MSERPAKEALKTWGVLRLAGPPPEPIGSCVRAGNTRSGLPRMTSTCLVLPHLTDADLEKIITGEPHTRLRYYSPQHTDSALYPVIGQITAIPHK